MTYILLTIRPQRILVSTDIEHGDALDPHLGASRSLVQVGEWRRAAEHLENLVEFSDDIEACFWLNLRLADVYIEAGRSSQARSKLEAAKICSLQLKAFDPRFSSAIDLFAAKAALESDRDADASRLLKNALPKARASREGDRSRRMNEALVEGLLVRCELAHGQGALEDALASASEAEEVSNRCMFISPVLASRARTMVALSRIFLWKEPIGAERDLLCCYASATSAGYVYEAATIAAHLSGLYRISGRHGQAHQILSETLGAARVLGPSVPLTSVLIESAYTEFELKRFDDAARILTEVERSSSQGFVSVAELLLAQIYLVKSQFREALLLAESVEQKFARMGRTRFTGRALVTQAKAYWLMGQRRQALRILRVAVDVLSSVGQPLIANAARKMLAEPRRLSLLPT